MFLTLTPLILKCQSPENETNSIRKCAKNTYEFVAYILDILTPIAVLVIGLLGVFSVIPMPPAATWSLVGVGSTLIFATLFMQTLIYRF